MNIKLILTILILSLALKSYGQKSNDTLLKIWNNTKLEDSVRAIAYQDLIYSNYYGSKTDSAYAMTLDLIDFTKEKKIKKHKANALILLSDIENIFGNNVNAIKNLKESLSIHTELNNKKGIAMAINGLGVAHRKVYNLDEAEKYFKKSLELGEELKDTLLIAKTLIRIGNIYGWRFKSDQAMEYYVKSRDLAKSINSKYEEAVATINISSAHTQKKDFKKSKKEIDKAIKLGEDLDNYNILANAYGNLSRNYYQQQQYDSLIISASKMLSYAQEISLKEKIDSAYFFLYQAYKGKRDFDLTIKYHDLRRNQRTTIDDISAVQMLEKIKIDNNRTKDSLLNINKTLKLGIKHKNEKSNLVLAWGGSLSALSFLTFVIIRKSKRKQRKAEEDRQRQIVEKEKLLKDSEMLSINAMISGQEKERQRIAVDLHDSVGATLTAAKLQFEYLMKHQTNNDEATGLAKKISMLLESAYNETRSIAHLKNSGVMAKDGLLPAVEELAKNASGVNELLFEVQSFGLDQRLENAMEISIFRIIQELVTNVIKHANATHAIIHLTNHKNNLNIMIEDDGAGFNPKQLSKTTKGMGISNIDKRVDHLNGKLTIESEPEKGTTVIIDIPL